MFSVAAQSGWARITGLEAAATYYFALRARDSGAPPYLGVWVRDPAIGLSYKWASAGQRIRAAVLGDQNNVRDSPGHR